MIWLVRHVLLGIAFAAAGLGLAQEPWRSGLETGARPGPYSSVVICGTNRGTTHCFICDTGDKPAVIIFARELSDPLGKLAHGLDVALAKHKDANLRSWITFLHEDQTKVDAAISKWAKKHAVGNVPLAVFEDLGGPPAYHLARDADVTVMLALNQKVVANFAFRAGELTDARIDEVLKAVPELVKK
jgi:hypothetical protein